MARNRWLWIGCGGCLGIVIILILLMTGGFIYFYQYGIGIKEKLEQLDREIRALNENFPFTPPEAYAIAEERYREFLSIREKTIRLTQEELGWLIRFSEDPESKGGLTIFQLVYKFVNLPNSLGSIGLDLTGRLNTQKMSWDEYQYLTGVTISVLLSWQSEPELSEQRKIADSYIKLLRTINENTDRTEREHPGTHIDLGPFQIDEFKTNAQRFQDIPNEIHDMIYDNHLQIMSSQSGVFVDAFVMEELG